MHFYKPQGSAQAHFPLIGHLYHESFILMKYKRDFKSTVLPRYINTSELQTLILPWFSFICKETKSAELLLHEGSRVCLCQHTPCYQSGILAAHIWNMRTELFFHSTEVFNLSGSSFFFQHLPALWVSPILLHHSKNRRLALGERHSTPHPTGFLFSGSQHSQSSQILY